MADAEREALADWAERGTEPGIDVPSRAEGSLRARLAQRAMPPTFQGRLTLAFVAILALTLVLVTTLVLNRLGNYFDQQQREELTARSLGVAQYVALVAEGASGLRPVVDETGVLDQAVVVELRRTSQQRILADRLAQADVSVQLGRLVGGTFVPATNGFFQALQQDQPTAG